MYDLNTIIFFLIIRKTMLRICTPVMQLQLKLFKKSQSESVFRLINVKNKF